MSEKRVNWSDLEINGGESLTRLSQEPCEVTILQLCQYTGKVVGVRTRTIRDNNNTEVRSRIMSPDLIQRLKDFRAMLIVKHGVTDHAVLSEAIDKFDELVNAVEREWSDLPNGYKRVNAALKAIREVDCKI